DLVVEALRARYLDQPQAARAHGGGHESRKGRLVTDRDVLQQGECGDNVGGTSRRSDAVQRPVFDNTLTQHLAGARARICVWFDPGNAVARLASLDEKRPETAP